MNKHFGGPSLLWVLDQALVNEVLEDSRPFRVDSGWIFSRNFILHLILTISEIGRFSIGKLEAENSQSPDIHLFIIAFLRFNHLWSHRPDSTHDILESALLFSENCCILEICQLDLATSIHEDTLGLYITMDSVFSMQVNDSLEHRINTELAKLLRELSSSVP